MPHQRLKPPNAQQYADGCKAHLRQDTVAGNRQLLLMAGGWAFEPSHSQLDASYAGRHPNCQAVTQYQINLAAVESFEDFVAAFNVGVINSLGGHWNGDLDALNDFLYWPVPHPYGLTLMGWQKCAGILGKLSTFNGRTMLSAIEEIFASNPQAVFSFE